MNEEHIDPDDKEETAVTQSSSTDIDARTLWHQKRELRQKERQRQIELEQQQEQQSLSSRIHIAQVNDYNDNDNDNDNRIQSIGTEYNIKHKRQMEHEILLSKKRAKGHGNNHNDNISSLESSNTHTATNGTIQNDDTDKNGNLNDQRIEEDDRNDNDGDDEKKSVPNGVVSLLDRVAMLQKEMSLYDREQLAKQEEEQRILREATKVSHNALLGATEIAQDTKYIQPMCSTWTIPTYMKSISEDVWDTIRTEWHMHVQGTNIPPPMKRFIDMKLPKPILHYLQTIKKIIKPTPIQIQGLPIILSGRDMIGIAFTGSGKTLTFTLPLLMMALEEELRLPIIANEGPIGIILSPSRELAKQTYDLLSELCQALIIQPNNDTTKSEYPLIRTQLMIGGEPLRDQIEIVKTQGVHCIVATPGRLRDVLKRRHIHLINCRYICLDEADRMLDMGFDVEVGEIMNYFHHQRQTLLFSATFPKKFQDFASQTLVQPIIVNVGRAGAANLDVIQEVEYVKEEAKIVYLLHCLQKTAPPVIIFCERTSGVDDIYEYLLLKGVESVSIHGGKDQEERNEAIQLFKAGMKDVLIATDIAAKGLDFPSIQHVINYDMPNEIENYVHRIGRTGRAGKTGVATTFINKNCDETTLLDLKALLVEAKQRIPPVLLMLDDPRDQNNNNAGGNSSTGVGCSFCGGLGHTIIDCPKIDKDAKRVAGSHRDVLTSTGGGGDW
jgi:ATP-dependent RNA helicase DDX41